MEFTMIETGWLSILPPIIAIALALITKEVYSSCNSCCNRVCHRLSDRGLYENTGQGIIVEEDC